MTDITAYINGQDHDDLESQQLTLCNPANGRASRTLPEGTPACIDSAVCAARQAFDDRRWSELSPSQRCEILQRFADLIEAESLELDRMDALDMGKPVSLSLFNADSAAKLVRHCADSISHVLGDVYASDKTTFVSQRRVPIGVVAAITPWNFPTVNALMKLAPALAVGNTVVLKPSENSPQSAMRLAKLATVAGLPNGVLNIVHGSGINVGRTLALHEGVDMISFTGSTSVGKRMLQYSSESNMKKVHVECGGKSPHIVFPDYADLDEVADLIVQLILVNQGQWCSTGSRVLVHKDIEERLVEKLAVRFKTFVAGDPLEPSTTFGPLVNEQQLNRVLEYIEKGKASGATLVAGGQRILVETGGYYVEPTLFSGVKSHDRIAQEEIFGPVLSVIAFDDEEEAIEIANSTVYGLFAHVWTSGITTGMRVAKRMNSGVAIHASKPVGEGAGLALSMEPFAQSGLGVEGGVAGMEAYTRRQVIWLNHG